MTHAFRSSMIIPCPISGVFAFFSDAMNLQRIFRFREETIREIFQSPD
ncbi:MAG: hypothetical protein JXL84_16835 [Deltaproteobacteria bacterium]|nr:hypothetical protein [Deltaproteobacteria bacterium]